MPLMRGNSRQVVGENVRELKNSGYPEDQAIAIALHKSYEDEEQKETPGPSGWSPKERHERGTDKSGGQFVLIESRENADSENAITKRLYGTDRGDIKLPADKKKAKK